MPVPTYVDGDLRIQFLSDHLVRLERKGPKGFEDRPTFTVVGRAWPGTPFRKVGNRLVTKGYTVVLNGRDLRGVKVLVGTTPAYTVGDLPKPQWLPAPGTKTPVWAMADSPRMVPPKGGAIAANAVPPTSRYDVGNDAPDLYLFVGSDPKRLRADYLRLTGPIPLVPRYTLGFWDSRYYPYSEKTALGTIDEYRNRKIPLDLFVCDTDWRVGASKGYEIDTRLFPDMTGFLRRAHAKGVRIMFNDHPEPKAATALDPAETLYRWNNLTDLLGRGVDVWWYDRNWSTRLREPMPGLRPEVWGASVFHDVTAAFRPDVRPMIMANVDGIDNGIRNRPPHPAFHRYPIYWTGDTIATWPYLRRAVENGVDGGALAMLPYINEDAGGHNGTPSPELYTRFMQFCALSPVMRAHCTAGMIRYPWAFGPQAEQATVESIRFRYRLIPTLYSAVHRASADGTPLLRRLDLEWPDYAEAATTRQYLLGDDLLVSPVTDAEASDLMPFRSAFRGEYFANKDLEGEPVLTRDDKAIDFDWGQGSPDPKLPNDKFSVRWTGRIGPMPRTMNYKFGTSSDDGIRVWIDGKRVVDQWRPLDSAGSATQIRLEEGKSYDVRVEYFEEGGGANVHFLWGGTQPSRTAAMPWTFWTPPGAWIDPWTGRRIMGPTSVTMPANLRRVPMLVRDGAVFFLGDDRVKNSDEQMKKPITVEAFPGPKTTRTLVEDDGISVNAARTVRTATAERTATGVRVSLSPATTPATYPAKPREFKFRVHLRPGETPKRVTLNGKPARYRTETAGGTAAGLDTIFKARGGRVIEINFRAYGGQAPTIDVQTR